MKITQPWHQERGQRGVPPSGVVGEGKKNGAL